MEFSQIPALCTVFSGGKLLVLAKKGESLSLLSLDRNLQIGEELANFRGSRGFILEAAKDDYLLSVDDKILQFKGNEEKILLLAHSPSNSFWHSTRCGEGVFVQEYGESPTGIFFSDDYVNWRLLATNHQIDKFSRHFHNLSYDPLRNWLVATLGDANMIRVAISEDKGKTWRSLFEGWQQFVPIVTLKDMLVFGMDSGIARGGVGIYYPKRDEWEFIFLKWLNERVKYVQMMELELLDNGVWVASSDTPQAVFASKDLKTWYVIYFEQLNNAFNNHLMINETSDSVICSTGKSLLVFGKRELENLTSGTEPTLALYPDYAGKIKGFCFVLKRKLMNRNQ